MKTVLDKSTRDELISRINKLSEKSVAQWGKMNVYQMMRHCIQWEEMALGKKIYKQSFIGRLFGKMALKGFIKDEKPFKRNEPTVPDFKIKEQTGNIPVEQQKWISVLEDYAKFSNDHFIHPFFGKMTKEEIGYMAYKHIDHHLRQFNA